MLLNSLQENTSQECCFNNHNITVENVVFDTEGDAVAVSRHLFVSYQNYGSRAISVYLL